MSDNTKPMEGLADRLRKLVGGGRVEWRVQDPVEKCYCISFDHSDTVDPERAAREWFAEHQAKYPHGRSAHYEVAEVRVFTELERAAIEAADALEAAASHKGAPVAARWHDLKTDPAVWDAVAAGLKTFEIRRNDRGFKVGDGLRLLKTRYSGWEMKEAGYPLEYIGEPLERVVSHILEGPVYGLDAGWVCMSFAANPQEPPKAGERFYAPFDAFKDVAGRLGWDTEQEHAGGLFRDKQLQALWDGIARNGADHEVSKPDEKKDAAAHPLPDAASDRLEWVDCDGFHHSMGRAVALKVLQALYEEWPGGLDEIEAALRSRVQPDAALLRQALAALEGLFPYAQQGRPAVTLAPASSVEAYIRAIGRHDSAISALREAIGEKT